MHTNAESDIDDADLNLNIDEIDDSDAAVHPGEHESNSDASDDMVSRSP